MARKTRNQIMMNDSGQLEEKQDEEAGEINQETITTTNQVF